MKITKKSILQAADEEIISHEQAENLYSFFKTLPSTSPGFDFTNILYYMGGLVAIGAMSLFMTLGWEDFGGFGIFCISLVYGAIGLTLASLFQKKGYAVPAGICATFVVVLTPLAIYGLQVAMGWWPEGSPYREYHIYIKWHWIFLELGTLLSGAIIAWFYRYKFLQMPIAVTLWYMSMDLASMIAGGRPGYDLRWTVSMWFGLAMILFAFVVDIRSRKSGDYAFWLYLFGVIAFWGGLTGQHSDSEITKFIYCGINVILIGVGVVLVRRVFVVFGAIGCSIYLGHLASEVFKNSWFFPIALTAIGLGIVYMGIVWQKNEQRITQQVRQFLPDLLRELLDERA